MSGYIVRLVILLACGGALWWTIAYVSKTERTPAAAEKDQHLKPTQGGILHTEKVRGPLSTSIRLIGTPSGIVGSSFQMEATVTASRDADGTSYRWSLPAGLKLVNGELTGVLPPLGKGESHSRTITVMQAESGNHQVHFAVDGASRGVRFGSVSQYNTIFEEFLQAERETIRKQALEHSLTHPIRVGSSRVDLQACKLEYSIVSPK